jgi:PqqD family protein of HPr-rel-A system
LRGTAVEQGKPVRKLTVQRGKIGNESVLFNKETGAVHVLNPTADRIWELCDGEHSIQEIEDEVRREFHPDGDRDIAADIRNVLERFTKEGLLDT